MSESGIEKQEEEISIDLGKLFRHYLKHWVAILVSTVAAALLALLVTLIFITPKYRASVTIYVNNIASTQSVETVTGSNLQTAQKLVNTYVNIIKSNTVLKAVIERGGLDCTAAELRSIMSASQIENTEMFTVSVSHPDPEVATTIANTIAELAPAQITKIVKGSSTEIIDYAEQPGHPYTPSYPKNIVLGALAGAVIMTALLTIQYLVDVRIKEEEDLTQYFKIPVLAAIPAYTAPDEGGRSEHYKFNGHKGKGGRN